jgi:hypothetical protein
MRDESLEIPLYCFRNVTQKILLRLSLIVKMSGLGTAVWFYWLLGASGIEMWMNFLAQLASLTSWLN